MIVDYPLGVWPGLHAAIEAPHSPLLVWTKDPANGIMTPHYPEREIIAARDREIQMSKAELCALRRKNQQWHDIWSATEAKRQELEDANAALRSIAADLEDVQRQNVRLEEENARLRATFGPQTDADLPDPPRRPDGTIAPKAKPWAPPRPAGDTRRVGS